MKLDGPHREHKSYCGSLLTILFVTISVVFIYTKILTIVKKQDIDIMSVIEEAAISYDDKFDANDGFFVAAALTAYDSEEEIVEEERYGELVIEHYGWGNYEDAIEVAS